MLNRVNSVFAALMAIAALASGCRSADVPPDTGVIPAPTGSITLEEDLLLGTDDPLFASIGDVAADADGNIYVAEARDPTNIYKFDRSGMLVGTVGAMGEGPGEYERPSDIMIDGDSIVVWDNGSDDLTVYESDGTYRRSGMTVSTENPRSPGILGKFDGGYFLRETPYISTSMTEEEMAENVLLRALHDDGSVGDVIWASPRAEYMYHSDENYLMGWSRPFGRSTKCTSFADRFYCAWSESLDIRGFTAAGDTLPPIRIAFTPLPVTAAERQQERENAHEFFVDRLNIPDTRPALDDMIADDRGRLWLKVRLDRGDDVTNYWIVDPADRSIVATTLTGNVRVISVHDGLAYGSLSIPDGAGLVVRYRIEE